MKTFTFAFTKILWEEEGVGKTPMLPPCPSESEEETGRKSKDKSPLRPPTPEGRNKKSGLVHNAAAPSTRN